MRPVLRRSIDRGHKPSEDYTEPDHGAGLFKTKPPPVRQVDQAPRQRLTQDEKKYLRRRGFQQWKRQRRQNPYPLSQQPTKPV